MSESLQREIDTILAINAGLTVIVSSMIATHPNYKQFQLHVTSVLETADQGSFLNTLSDRQREVARELVELLQQTREVRAQIDPLARLFGKGAS